jgi:sugar phosphate isomerase/epimerase
MNYSIGCNIVDPLCDKKDHYTLEVYLKNIALYRDYGFSHLEFSHVTAISEDDAKHIRDFALQRGIVPWSVHLEHLNEPGEDELQKYFETQEQCIKIAKALGMYVCICHIPNLEPRAGDLKRDIEVLSRLADITGKYGLKLAIETPPYEYLIEIVDTINRDDVGINLDTGHTFLEGKNPAKAARAIGKRLFTSHLQDNFGTNDDHQPPGLGNIDWRELLTALNDIGYNAPLMLELTGEGVKAKRATENLKDYPLEKEIIFGKAYLDFIAKSF